MHRSDHDNRPKWLSCKNALIPDMLAMDPLKMPVFEITGAEFTKSEAHTADGISIRFPRITKQRDDKSPNEATSLKELKHLFEASKDGQNLQMLMDGLDDDDIDIKTTLQGNTPSKRKSDSVEAEVVKKSKTTRSVVVASTIDNNVKHQSEDKIDIKTTLQGDSSRKRKSDSVRSEVVKKSKTTRSTTSTVDNIVRQKCEDMFNGISLYVCDGVRELCREELRYFKKWWGDETSNSKKCTHVLHKCNSTEETLESARYKI